MDFMGKTMSILQIKSKKKKMVNWAITFLVSLLLLLLFFENGKIWVGYSTVNAENKGDSLNRKN